MSVASWCCKSFCVVPCVSFCTGQFVMVPLNMTCLHCLQHSLFEHLFHLYLYIMYVDPYDTNVYLTYRDALWHNYDYGNRLGTAFASRIVIQHGIQTTINACLVHEVDTMNMILYVSLLHDSHSCCCSCPRYCWPLFEISFTFV